LTGARGKKIVLWSIVWFNLITLSLPTVIILGASLTSGDIVQFPPDGLSLKWYKHLWLLDDFKEAFMRTIYVSVICTVVSIPVGTMAALAMARYRIALRMALQVYLLLPFTIPLVVSGLGMMLVFGEIRILGRLWPVGIGLCIINLPFMIWAVSATVNALDDELENAAANCGAPPLQTFLTVTLPCVMPGVITGALLMFILALNEFLVCLFLTDARIVTLPVSIYNSIRSVITPDLAAVSVVYIVVAFAAVWLLDKVVGLELFLRSK
jgi:putative spermidine/putrescine transport system permease protein